MTDTTTTATSSRWSSRKFWAAMFWETIMTILFWTGKLPVEQFVTLTSLLLGGYLVSNVAQKVFAPTTKGGITND